MDYADILNGTGGRILATSPAVGWARADGSWEIVRELGRAVTRHLVIVGMAGAERTAEQAVSMERRRGHARHLLGSPAGPDELAWAISETGRVPCPSGIGAEWTAEAAVSWYVSAVLAVQDERAGRQSMLEDEPAPDPWPAWVDEWLERLVNPAKRDYALRAAHCIYHDLPEPASEGHSWEGDIWSKLGRRYGAEQERLTRADNRRIMVASSTGAPCAR